MTVEELFRGESKNVEFKAMLPRDSEKYTKTIVAFANTQGGKLVVGVDDRTRQVVGVDEEFLFRMMDSISNAVSDSCEPQIIPSVEPQTLDGKTVIVVTVVPGPNRPYFLKSKGKAGGTFVRVAGTSRPAHPEKIKELELEGARISWDELTCVGYEVKEEAVEKLCGDIVRYRKAAGLPGRDVRPAQLINWKLLRYSGEVLLASNAFVLLTSDYFPFSKTQCAVFKGTERSVFLDKREYTGPLYEQIEEAVSFVLRNIRLGAVVEGLVRRESYELPVAAVREMLVNAHCHRNLADSSCVQVALYDDRLEVTSPGGLYNGLTYEELMNGHSKLRNRVVADVFNQMGLVEAWGTGIRRIREAAESQGLPAPEFLVFDDMFRVNLFRNPLPVPGRHSGGDALEGQREYAGELWAEHRNCVREAVEKFGEGLWEGKKEFGEGPGKGQSEFGDNSGKEQVRFGGTLEKVRRSSVESSEKEAYRLSEMQRKILGMVRVNNRISAKGMAEALAVSSRAVEKNIRQLREDGILIRHGSPRGGFWEISGGIW